MQLPLDKSQQKRALSPRETVLKRVFDLVLALGIAPVILPLAAVMAVGARIFNGKGIYVQTRVGLYGVPFRLYKICSMRPQEGVTTTVTTANDPRITPFGYFLRRSKLDELPQLWNVLRGDMSFVGPRPDVPEAYAALPESDVIVLCVQPGITGAASLAYHDEEEMLLDVDDPERYNAEVIFPRKIRISCEYIANYSLVSDIIILYKTVFGNKQD